MQKIFLLVFTYIISKNNHPMMTLIFILPLSLMISSMIFFKLLSYWMTLLIIMVYTGGLMVIFMYIVSLNPNEEDMTFKTPPFIILFFFIYLFSLYFKNNFMLTESYNINFLSLLIMTTMITMMVHTSSILIIYPFKGLKTSM